MMQSCPVVLIGTEGVLRPLEQILRTLVIDDELDKLATENAIGTAANYIDIVRWRGLRLIGSNDFILIMAFYVSLKKQTWLFTALINTFINMLSQ